MLRRALALVSLGLSGCFPMPVAIVDEPRALDATILEGEWFVAATNFPMWLEDGKCDPRFRYSNIEMKDGVAKMDDEVSYVVPGETERATLLGTDQQDHNQPAHFTWRGEGPLLFVSSEWYVARVSPDRSFALIYFTNAIVSPSGVDVITREAHPSRDVVREAEAWLREDALLREKSKGLVWLRGPKQKPPAACK